MSPSPDFNQRRDGVATRSTRAKVADSRLQQLPLRLTRSFADGLRGSYPDTAAMYDKMAEEAIEHHDMLLELYRRKFGEFLPLIRRQD
jgi:hypothetical protein